MAEKPPAMPTALDLAIWLRGAAKPKEQLSNLNRNLPYTGGSKWLALMLTPQPLGSLGE